MTWLILVLTLPTSSALAQGGQLPLQVPILAPAPAAQLPQQLPGLITEQTPAFTNLTIEPPPSLSMPPTLLLGSSRRVDLATPAALRETPIEQIAPPGFLGQMEKIFDAQDIEWPTGTTTSVHVQAKSDDGVGRWVPYFSILQDIDEWDAHERYGLGAGATFRLTRDLRFDVEVQYLQSSGDENPALRDEVRGLGLFTLSF